MGEGGEGADLALLFVVDLQLSLVLDLLPYLRAKRERRMGIVE